MTYLDKVMQTLETKEEENGDSQKKVATFQADADKRKQYTRCPNLRFHDIPEVDGENTHVVVIVTNQKFGLAHIGLAHIGAEHMARSHIQGPMQDEQGCSLKRAVTVRFRSEAVRDDVFRACTRLKDYTRQNKDDQAHLNEDLTVKRAMLAH